MSNATTTSPANQHRESVWRPAIDVIEDTDGITVYADLPGVNKDRLKINVDGDTLQIDGVLQSSVTAGTSPLYVEMKCTHFRRAFTLSRELDSANIRAELRDGLLTLRVPKLEEAKPRRIDIAVQ